MLKTRKVPCSNGQGTGMMLVLTHHWLITFEMVCAGRDKEAAHVLSRKGERWEGKEVGRKGGGRHKREGIRERDENHTSLHACACVPLFLFYVYTFPASRSPSHSIPLSPPSLLIHNSQLSFVFPTQHNTPPPFISSLSLVAAL